MTTATLTALCIDLGAAVRVRVRVQERDLSGNLTDTDPTAITFTAKRPDSTLAVIGPTHDSLGHYSVEFTPTAVGQWWWKWQTTDPDGVDEGSFLVTTPRVI